MRRRGVVESREVRTCEIGVRAEARFFRATLTGCGTSAARSQDPSVPFQPLTSITIPSMSAPLIVRHTEKSSSSAYFNLTTLINLYDTLASGSVSSHQLIVLASNKSLFDQVFRLQHTALQHAHHCSSRIIEDR